MSEQQERLPYASHTMWWEPLDNSGEKLDDSSLMIIVGIDNDQSGGSLLRDFGRSWVNPEWTAMRWGKGAMHISMEFHAFVGAVNFFGRHRQQSNDRLNLTETNIPSVVQIVEELRHNPQRGEDGAFVAKALKQMSYRSVAQP